MSVKNTSKNNGASVNVLDPITNEVLAVLPLTEAKAAQAEANAEAEAFRAKVNAEAKAEAEAIRANVAKAQAEKAQAEAEALAQAEAEALEAEAQAEAEAEAKAAKAEAKAEALAKARAAIVAQAEAEAKAEAARAKEQAEARAKAEAKAQAEANLRGESYFAEYDAFKAAYKAGKRIFLLPSLGKSLLESFEREVITTGIVNGVTRLVTDLPESTLFLSHEGMERLVIAESAYTKIKAASDKQTIRNEGQAEANAVYDTRKTNESILRMKAEIREQVSNGVYIRVPSIVFTNVHGRTTLPVPIVVSPKDGETAEATEAKIRKAFFQQAGKLAEKETGAAVFALGDGNSVMEYFVSVPNTARF